jgi:hypothetical protein
MSGDTRAVLPDLSQTGRDLEPAIQAGRAVMAYWKEHGYTGPEPYERGADDCEPETEPAAPYRTTYDTHPADRTIRRAIEPAWGPEPGRGAAHYDSAEHYPREEWPHHPVPAERAWDVEDVIALYLPGAGAAAQEQAQYEAGQ